VYRGILPELPKLISSNQNRYPNLVSDISGSGNSCLGLGNSDMGNGYRVFYPGLRDDDAMPVALPRRRPPSSPLSLAADMQRAGTMSANGSCRLIPPKSKRTVHNSHFRAEARGPGPQRSITESLDNPQCPVRLAEKKKLLLILIYCEKKNYSITEK